MSRIVEGDFPDRGTGRFGPARRVPGNSGAGQGGPPRPGGRTTDTTAEEADVHLDFLRPLFDGPGPWASVYTAPPHTDASAAKERELAIRDLRRTMGEAGVDTATADAVAGTLSGLTHDDAPHGAAVFAAGGRTVLCHALPRRVPRPGFQWSPLPHLVPLVEACDPDLRCLVARIDRTGADFELRDGVVGHDAGGARGKDYPVHRTATADWSERHFQLKVEDTWEHNAGVVAERIAESAEQAHADVVVLAGDERERQEVYDRLAAPLRKQTVISGHGGRAPGADSPQLEVDIDEALEEFTQRRDRELLDRLQSGGSQDAVVGVPSLVEAALEHRIGTLLLHPPGGDLDREVWVGRDPEQLSARRTADEPISVGAGDALLRAAVTTDAEVAVVGADRTEPGEEDREGRGGSRRRATVSAADAGSGTGEEGGAAADLSQRAQSALPGGLGAVARWSYGGSG
jgi:hypothetical protein